MCRWLTAVSNLVISKSPVAERSASHVPSSKDEIIVEELDTLIRRYARLSGGIPSPPYLTLTSPKTSVMRCLRGGAAVR
jgi:hypothetical protein